MAVNLMKRDVPFSVSVSKRKKLIKQTYFKLFNEQLFKAVKTLAS